jgi:hypothetical protein
MNSAILKLLHEQSLEHYEQYNMKIATRTIFEKICTIPLLFYAQNIPLLGHLPKNIVTPRTSPVLLSSFIGENIILTIHLQKYICFTVCRLKNIFTYNHLEIFVRTSIFFHRITITLHGAGKIIIPNHEATVAVTHYFNNVTVSLKNI